MPKTKQKHIISTSEKQDAELQIKEMQKQIDYDTKDFTIELLIEKLTLKKGFCFYSATQSFFGMGG